MKKTFDAKGQMDKLNQTALDVEFLVISVIQGVALGALAAAGNSPIITLQFQTWPYIVTAFIIILIFWSGAIIHAVSFIDWPIDLYHSFLYFLASLLEIMTITNLANPFLWFVAMLFFNIVVLGLYIYDLHLMKQHKKKFDLSHRGEELFHHMISEQRKELRIILPFSLGFNVSAVAVLYLFPAEFIDGGYHLIFIVLQLIFVSAFLLYKLKAFNKLSLLLSH